MDIQLAIEIFKTITPEQLEAYNVIAMPTALFFMILLTIFQLMCNRIEKAIDKRKTKPSE